MSHVFAKRSTGKRWESIQLQGFSVTLLRIDREQFFAKGVTSLAASGCFCLCWNPLANEVACLVLGDLSSPNASGAFCNPHVAHASLSCQKVSAKDRREPRKKTLVLTVAPNV